MSAPAQFPRSAHVEGDLVVSASVLKGYLAAVP